MFRGRKLLIATKHKKERVIAPLLEKDLGVTCFTVAGFDTDIFGTFSGEVERKDGPIATARKKCHLALEFANCDLVLSSEGSFGPHPAFHFLPANEEFLVLIDKKNNLEIVARELSVETNYNGSEIKTEKELFDFAQRAKFPDHGLIIKRARYDFTDIVKGISNRNHLRDTFKHFISKYGEAYIETDMRAMYNPTRMKVIEKAAQKLAQKVNSCCPNCSLPGFGITDYKQGLPCELCNFPTSGILSHIYVCQRCAFEEEEKYPNGKYFENPMYCDTCNP